MRIARRSQTAIGKGLRRRLRRHGRDDDLEHARGEAPRPGRLDRARAGAPRRRSGSRRSTTASPTRASATSSHWGYGTGWGVVRGLLGATGHAAAGDRRPRRRHLGQRAGDAARARRRAAGRLLGREEIAIDAFHHAVYAIATALAYELLSAGRADGDR